MRGIGANFGHFILLQHKLGGLGLVTGIWADDKEARAAPRRTEPNHLYPDAYYKTFPM